jgi:hypothetical protein
LLSLPPLQESEDQPTNKATITFRSWDSHILAVLPPALTAEFPAKLTHRSGVSKALFSWMRTCFLNGMGAKQFSDALLVQHLLRYDELHLQYLKFLAKRPINSYIGVKYKSFLPFDDTSPHGFHGFVPSAAYLRDIYDDFMEEHQHEIDQMAAITLGEICAIDHSHKVCHLTVLQVEVIDNISDCQAYCEGSGRTHLHGATDSYE